MVINSHFSSFYPHATKTQVRIARELKLHVIPFAKGEGRFAKGDWVHKGMFARGDLQGHRRFHLYVCLSSIQMVHYRPFFTEGTFAKGREGVIVRLSRYVSYSAFRCFRQCYFRAVDTETKGSTQLGEAKFTAIYVALRHLIIFIRGQATSSALHNCCTFSLTFVCLARHTALQLFPRYSVDICKCTNASKLISLNRSSCRLQNLWTSVVRIGHVAIQPLNSFSFPIPGNRPVSSNKDVLVVTLIDKNA